MLLVFNHLHGGAEGVAIFEKMRQEKYEPISRFPSRGDFFYQRSAKPLISDGCNKAVTDYLTRFLKAIQESKLDSKSIYHRLTLAIYPYIQNSILQPHDRRDDIRTISAKLSSLYTESSKLPIITTPLKGISKKPEKSCFSPDGTVVYYRPDMIMLRNLETNQSRDLEPRTLKNSWSERIWFRPAACSNDSIALVLSKDNTGLTRFEIRNFTQFSTRGSFSPFRLDDQIDMIALAPNRRFVALASKPQGRMSRARVRLYNLDNINDVDNQPLSTHREDTPVSGQYSEALSHDSRLLRDEDDMLQNVIEFNKIEHVKWHIDLCFCSRSETLYHAFRTDKPQKNDIPQHGVTVRMRSIRNGNYMEDIYIENKETARNHRHFIPEIYPLRTQIGFFVIKREEYITMYSHLKPNGVNYWIKGVSSLRKMLITQDDRLAIVLASPSNSNLEFYAPDLDDSERVQKLDLNGKVPYRPEEDAVCLVETDDRLDIRIISLKRKCRYSFMIERRGIFR
ncbi:hypothetical protein GGS24DRAFT_260384 [Hypoxylon argillaceum]|nr:hypothetical protein GGS24DRAFT_260384 [Hypoxylon argillaceum]